MDATHNTEDAAAQDRLRWRGLREQLAGEGASEQVLTHLDQALENSETPEGPAGRMLVADPDGVVIDQLTPEPPPAPSAHWGTVPDLLTLVVASPEPVRTVVVHLDETGGRVGVPSEPGEWLGGEGPVHKVPGGGYAHLGMQERVEERWRRNTASVAAAVDKQVSKLSAELVVVSGDARSRSRLIDELSPRSVELVLEVENTGGHEVELGDDLVERAADDVRVRRLREAFNRFATAYGRSEGLAVTGLADVVAASRAQAVETLLVDPFSLPGTEVYVGAEPELLALHEEDLQVLGAEPIGRVDAGTALLRASASAAAELVLIGNGATPVRDPLDPDAAKPEPYELVDGPLEDTSEQVPEPELRDGVGAILRFPIR
jgi:hypothetical protein